jgi:hypothetical protein
MSEKKYVLVGNYAVAGTEKFLSHALRIREPNWVTFCGLHLKYHTGQQWEELDEEGQPSCLRCQLAIGAMERRIKARKPAK